MFIALYSDHEVEMALVQNDIDIKNKYGGETTKCVTDLKKRPRQVRSAMLVVGDL